ncbi:MAG: ATP-binding protein, partial [Actinomycetota bacterium]|nr:ATP-binding protein [Actinomycetota bacterium]
DRPIDPDMAFVQVFDLQGRVLEASEVLTEPLLSARQLEGLATRQFLDADVVLVDETVKARLFAVASAGGTVLVVGTSVEEQGEALAGLARLLWFGAPAALGATTWIAFLLAGAALRPVERMRLEAAAISAGEPGRRLPVPATGDEIARLGATLNSMLERMESALERERRFVDDASHELRTPLAILKAELDLALSKSRTHGELLAALHSAAEESDRVGRLAEDLLVLARADRGGLPVRPVQLDLSALLSDISDSFKTVASRRGINIERRVAPDLYARVDPVRIRQAVCNLLDNALRHTPPEGQVEIGAERADGWVSIDVLDSGKGFAPDFIDNAFEPFARADHSRTRSEGGAGLGLAIVRAIAKAHGGTAVASNREAGGAQVTLTLHA